MRICQLFLPVLAWSQDDTVTLLSQDDSPTLLSLKLKVHTTLESGVDHLLDVVGSRNVTQMSALLQNLVEETITDGSQGYELDGEVKAALTMIKEALLGDIRGALKEAHCSDQKELHEQILCFEKCEIAKKEGAGSCGTRCEPKEHKECRDNLLERYKTHIADCRALDDYVAEFTKAECPKFDKKCCLLAHTTWNCGGLCESKIADLDVDDSLGTWINTQITKFEGAFNQWTKLHKKCTEAYTAYVKKDAECDCKQAECEARNCEYDSCHTLNCEDVYNKCWGRCEGEFTRTNDAKECLEKDRKIDWSATEKIECYVNVLLEKPDNQTLLDTCGSDDCYNKYREIMYNKCNDVCVEVDFEGEWGEHARREHKAGDSSGRHTEVKDQSTHQGADIDITGEGVNSVRTKHRGKGENRCTSHLDLDYQTPPCCQPCETRPSTPCEGGGYSSDKSSYMWLHYEQFKHFSADAIEDFDKSKCHTGEHQLSYAYNLCDCVECSGKPDLPPPVCTAAKACDAEYDYRKHDIVDGCGETGGGTVPELPSDGVCPEYTPALLAAADWQFGGSTGKGHTCNEVCASVGKVCNERSMELQTLVCSDETIIPIWAATHPNAPNNPTCNDVSHPCRQYAGTPFAKHAEQCAFFCPHGIENGARSVCNANSYGHHDVLCACQEAMVDEE